MQSIATENIYAFDYDDVNHLINTKQYVNGETAPSNKFVEQGLQYDKNSNILGFERLNPTSTDAYSFTYDGNQRSAVSGAASGSYTYDSNGNMTKDGLNNLDIAYNYLNLPTEVRGGGGDVKVRYSYLADGTKIESVDDAGSGYAYIGSLVYRKSNAGYELESVPFSAGRIYATSNINGTTYDVNYHLTDQVGSVRAVINGVGEVQQQSDYYAFGLRHASTDFATNDNRYQLTGKESQKDFGFNYLDFHARQYDPTGIQFTSQDPLQDDYASTSSYVYCLSNPVIHIDPDGCSTWVTALSNGTYQVVGGALDDDLNIYIVADENTVATGEEDVLGTTMTERSFCATNEITGETTWQVESIIDPNDKSGEEFLGDKIVGKAPSLLYFKEAGNRGENDFKAKGDESHYRGMPTGLKEGEYASARDIGNYAAGYAAASGGLNWAVTRLGFDYYNRKQNPGANESPSSTDAQLKGWKAYPQPTYLGR